MYENDQPKYVINITCEMIINFIHVRLNVRVRIRRTWDVSDKFLFRDLMNHFIVFH